MSSYAVEIEYNEDSTLCSLLQHYLRRERFVAARIPHPMEEKVRVKLHTVRGTVDAALRSAQNEARSDLEELRAAVCAAFETPTGTRAEPSTPPATHEARVTRSRTRKSAASQRGEDRR